MANVYTKDHRQIQFPTFDRMDYNVHNIIVQLIFVGFRSCDFLYPDNPDLNFVSIVYTVLEVASNEYGDFTNQLAQSSREDRWRLTNGSYASTPTNNLDEFQIQPIKPSIQRLNSNDSREVFSVPSEWTKLWILLGRCHIHYYRDWVSIVYLN